MSVSSISTVLIPYTPTYLSWENRSSEINEIIARAFERISCRAESKWGLFNGSHCYSMAGIKEHKLMKKIIREAAGKNKDFYALDIGAGNFQWGQALAKYLNAKNEIPKGATVHIIGIRGETNLEETITKIGQCKLYEFGKFQIESLVEQFQTLGMQLAGKVDLIVSRWCFRHLVDPTGTFVQAYDLLRPRTGHLLLDGFFFLHENETMADESLNFNDRMAQLCLETGAPFISFSYNEVRSLDHFVVNRPDDDPCHLSKQYLGVENELHYWQIGSETVTRFEETKKSNVERAPFLYESKYRGDKELYERLRQKGLLFNNNIAWGPLEEKDVNRKTPPLHLAITNNDEEAIYRYLEEGCDINESDASGYTPLHLAIAHSNYKLFSLLMEKKALTKLSAKGFTPLHLACKHDLNGCFITALIEAGSDINIEPKDSRNLCYTPLVLAIKEKNVKAVELLLAAKAFVNYTDRLSIDSNAIFCSLQQLLPKKWSEFKEFGEILEHIQKGNCVFLTEPESSFGHEFQKSAIMTKESKLIRVLVNPQTRFMKNRNYEELENISGCEANFTKKTVAYDSELRFGYSDSDGVN